MKWITKIKIAAASLAVLTLCAWAPAQVANIKVVTDANPDYSDMESMVRSITINWKTDAEKMYALFYWDHIARRQTQPMKMHGYEVSDPIRSYNDYGYTMCSTISGIKCSEWNYMGYPCRFFDISNHTVPDVWYDGAYHHYDNSLSMMYTLSDGKTIASIEDIGKTLSGPETGGKEVAGYIALYHALTGTSPNGYCEGADTERPLEQIVHDFSPRALKYRYYYFNQDRGHRYILNLRDGEVYARYYARQDAASPDAVVMKTKQPKDEYKADYAYFVPNGQTDDGKPKDPEVVNIRYHIRGNGIRAWTPLLDTAHLPDELNSSAGVQSANPGLEPAAAGQVAQAVFKIEGANVITGLKIHAELLTVTAGDAAAIAVSTTNGLRWKEVWKSGNSGENKADLRLVDEVNGSYEVLVKVTLQAAVKPEDALLKAISFETITEINGKTQPQLKLGANTVYVGTGEQTESIVFWPELRHNQYKAYAVDEKNLVSTVGDGKPAEGEEESKEFKEYLGNLFPEKSGEEAYVVFKVDAPTDVTSFTYGGRLYNRAPDGHIDFLHSFDDGKTWTKDYSLADIKAPWDVIHYETIRDVPAGTRSVLFKYSLNTSSNETRNCSLYAVRMEVDHKLGAPSAEPLEVTFNWRERQKDFTTIQRSHTQLVEKLPTTYTIDVGGYDQPIVDSLTINLKGARGDLKYGYSDGKDVGGSKWVGNWVTYGKNLALGKPYTAPPPTESHSGTDKDGTMLTDGRVGSSFTGGVNLKEGLIWLKGNNPEIVVDLGEPQKCAAFRIHTLGAPFLDAMKGQMKDKIEVLTSLDGKEFKSQGFIDTNLYWKDLPVNFMFPDDETLCAPNYFMPMPEPVEARYVKYKITNVRSLGVTEVQALDSYKIEPFDLKIALPDPASNGKPPANADISPNARKLTDSNMPPGYGKQLQVGGEKAQKPKKSDENNATTNPGA